MLVLADKVSALTRERHVRGEQARSAVKPTRWVSLAEGCPEVEGLRCCYHGWMFDTTGRGIERPAEPEDSTFKDRVRTKAYPVEELGGLVFAYLGPPPVPLLPRWDLLVME